MLIVDNHTLRQEGCGLQPDCGGGGGDSSGSQCTECWDCNCVDGN